ncbi:hypothetical protein HBI56_058540 [Parastagonospora nodorum]|uniref:Uncharacterized protein n=1 Tax=Phaeosphaeria nodorum (strain SN15 / ATCC MYA-4574 / FGSC 10173) TaxID=321614 RepID=A0A7U2I2C1_PHANO|nr:hypothetical protein HBH56_160100 [Parastagonospora nodorum]QRC97246.1 hypothetical protein JI435_410340 [Parastagonospora nodorum SN15]KAH3922382.1 hypothetical protein HBH54_224530 [Parastagonospora nodorum]KAH3947057.1 hypothetical protein HBH53_121810 [Parastagonospora nodorum]KAH3969700.1 hypothetical protein HBH52_169820 [Parastagonospora nodorum]
MVCPVWHLNFLSSLHLQHILRHCDYNDSVVTLSAFPVRGSGTLTLNSQTFLYSVWLCYVMHRSISHLAMLELK